MESTIAKAEVPQISALVKSFEDATSSHPLLRKAVHYCKTKEFVDDDNRIDTVEVAAIDLEAAALLHHLVLTLDPDVTFETGFGGGLSACVFVGTKRPSGANRHYSIDPYGLGGPGFITCSYLNEKHHHEFIHLKEPSEMALPRFVHQYAGKVKLALIDGSHLFDIALLDFVFLDRMCALGGCIIIDDACFPAMESLINFIRENRTDYKIETPHLRTTLLWKIGPYDTREWFHFRPFAVSPRHDWTYPS